MAFDIKFLKSIIKISHIPKIWPGYDGIMCKCVCVCVCVCARARVCIYAYMCAYVCLYVCVYVCEHTPDHTCAWRAKVNANCLFSCPLL